MIGKLFVLCIADDGDCRIMYLYHVILKDIIKMYTTIMNVLKSVYINFKAPSLTFI